MDKVQKHNSSKCISIVKGNENWLLVFRNSARRGSSALQSSRIMIFGLIEYRSWSTLVYLMTLSASQVMIRQLMNEMERMLKGMVLV
jgi:hypothetical protein